MEQQYLDVLVDGFASSTLWAFSNETRYLVMFGFGEADMVLASTMACIGSILACFLNYGIGRLFSIVQKKGDSTISPEAYAKWQQRFTGLMIFIGLFSWVHLVGVLVAASGFLRVRVLYAFPALILGQVLYYLYRHHQFAAF